MCASVCLRKTGTHVHVALCSESPSWLSSSFHLNLTVRDEEVKVARNERGSRFKELSTVIRMEVFIVFTVVSLYVAAPTLRVIEKSLNASEQNI